MKNMIRFLFVSVTLVASAQAEEVPVYRDQQLEVPGAVVVTEAGAVYYGDVRFKANADGSFALLDARRRNLAQVDSATVAVDPSFPAQAAVTASGELSIACVALEEPAVIRAGNTFTVVLAETPIDPLALCQPLIAVTEFTVEVPLELYGLEAGTYRVSVNGVATAFTLE